MTATTNRMIVKIDEDKCNGCGLCVPSCAEGALQIIDGKARLVSERYCDGLGACLGECPQGAITIEERQAEVFDEQAARRHVTEQERTQAESPCGCPSTRVACLRSTVNTAVTAIEHQPTSRLTNWPVQLTLVPAAAPFLDKADVVLVADCVPFAYAGFHQDFLENRAVLVACPKLDDFLAHQAKLTDILRHSDIKSLTVVHMEVPCCSGIVYMARQAISLSGHDLPLCEVTISINGDVIGS